MLHRRTLDKVAQPGLRFQGWRKLPLGSKIAVLVLALVALIAVFAPLVAPYNPGATGLAASETVTHVEGVGDIVSS